jgi:hypothetical protein
VYVPRNVQIRFPSLKPPHPPLLITTINVAAVTRGAYVSERRASCQRLENTSYNFRVWHKGRDEGGGGVGARGV